MCNKMDFCACMSCQSVSFYVTSFTKLYKFRHFAIDIINYFPTPKKNGAHLWKGPSFLCVMGGSVCICIHGKCRCRPIETDVVCQHECIGSERLAVRCHVGWFACADWSCCLLSYLSHLQSWFAQLHYNYNHLILIAIYTIY